MSGLAGARILVTRPQAQAAELIESLAALGAVPVPFPTIEIAPPEDPAVLDRAIAGLDGYAWVIFTSANGVAAFWQRLEALGNNQAAFGRARCAAIGPATAAALRQKGIQPAFTPPEFVAEAIIPGLGQVDGQRILLPRADIARPALLEQLLALGARAEEIAVYRTLPANPSVQALAELEKGVDMATFTSSSTVRNFFALLNERAAPLLQGAAIACIGPITAETARQHGLAVDLVAEEYTAPGLVAAIREYFELQRTNTNPKGLKDL